MTVLHGFTNEVIRQRRRELSTINNNQETIKDDPDDIGIRKKEAFLDVLLKAKVDGKPLTDSEVREEVDTFMFEVKTDENAYKIECHLDFFYSFDSGP